jgi:acyl carrier protein
MNKGKVKKFIEERAEKRMKLMGVENFSFGKNTDLVKEGIFDSLAFVDLIADCENEFGVQIDLEKYEPGEFTKAEKLVEIILSAPRTT